MTGPYLTTKNQGKHRTVEEAVENGMLFFVEVFVEDLVENPEMICRQKCAKARFKVIYIPKRGEAAVGKLFVVLRHPTRWPKYGIV